MHDDVTEPGEEQAPQACFARTDRAQRLGRQDRPVSLRRGRGNLDDVAAAILAQLLERRGLGTRVASFQAIATATYASLDLDGVR